MKGSEDKSLGKEPESQQGQLGKHRVALFDMDDTIIIDKNGEFVPDVLEFVRDLKNAGWLVGVVSHAYEGRKNKVVSELKDNWGVELDSFITIKDISHYKHGYCINEKYGSADSYIEKMEQHIDTQIEKNHSIEKKHQDFYDFTINTIEEYLKNNTPYYDDNLEILIADQKRLFLLIRGIIEKSEASKEKGLEYLNLLNENGKEESGLKRLVKDVSKSDLIKNENLDKLSMEELFDLLAKEIREDIEKNESKKLGEFYYFSTNDFWSKISKIIESRFKEEFHALINEVGKGADVEMAKKSFKNMGIKNEDLPESVVLVIGDNATDIKFAKDIAVKLHVGKVFALHLNAVGLNEERVFKAYDAIKSIQEVPNSNIIADTFTSYKDIRTHLDKSLLGSRLCEAVGEAPVLGESENSKPELDSRLKDREASGHHSAKILERRASTGSYISLSHV